jgi:hypothetical protein
LNPILNYRFECERVFFVDKNFTAAGLPDGLFSTKNPNFELALGRLQNVDIFYGHLEYFMEIWDIL